MGSAETGMARTNWTDSGSDLRLFLVPSPGNSRFVEIFPVLLESGRRVSDLGIAGSSLAESDFGLGSFGKGFPVKLCIIV